MNKLIAMIGFLALGLSPSFIDWEQSPELHNQIIIYYVVTILLIWFGMDGWINGGK